MPYLVSDFVEGADPGRLLTARPPDARARRPGSSPRSPTPCSTPTSAGSSTATSSRRTSCSTTTGRPHVMDFGLAKRDAGEITMTLDGQVLGTPAYMSPEQARGEGAPGRRPRRRLQPGGRPLRAADRRAAVPRQHADAAAPGAARRAAAAAEAQRPDPARPGDDLPQGDGQGAGAAVRHRGGSWPTTCGDFWTASRSRPGRSEGSSRSWRWAMCHPTIAALVVVTVVAGTIDRRGRRRPRL